MRKNNEKNEIIEKKIIIRRGERFFKMNAIFVEENRTKLKKKKRIEKQVGGKQHDITETKP